jgi:hypothetical protein
MDVRRPTEEVADLERGGLLSLQSERVDAVDQRHRIPCGKVACELQRCVEVRVDLEHARAVHERGRHLPHRDLAPGDEDGAREPGLGRVCRG